MILLVDDDSSVLVVTSLILKSFGHCVVTAQTAGAAVATWHDCGQSFDLALIDFALPDGSGTELARGLIEQKPSLEVLLMSASHTALIEIPAEILERVRVIQKPFTIDSLRMALLAFSMARPGAAAAREFVPARY